MVTAATPSPYGLTIIQWFWYGPPRAAKGATMTEQSEMSGFQEILARKEAELTHVLRKRDGITIEKSADQMDEIQYASERDLAIRNVDRESRLLLQVRAALRRIQNGSFGICIDCESEISPKRLSAVPSAPRCIECQGAADRGEHAGTESLGETLVNSM
jgi:DnaK suppressor protein